MSEFMQSEKGKPMLLLDGFLYVKDKQVRTKIYWKCRHFAKKCKGHAITVDGNISAFSGEHNHTGDPINVEVRQFLERVKTNAKTARDLPHYIIFNVTSEISGVAAPAVPLTSSIKRSIRQVH